DLDPVGTLDRAALAIGAAHRCDFGPELQELLAAQGKLAVAFGISQESKHVRNRDAPLANATAGAAHPAVFRTDGDELRGQQLLVLLGVRFHHGAHVFFQLIVTRHADDGGVDRLVLEGPFDRGNRNALLAEPRAIPSYPEKSRRCLRPLLYDECQVSSTSQD